MNEKIRKALDAIPELTLADCILHFDAKATERDKAIAGMVEIEDEEFECDNSIVSEGEDNGAYVLGWRWVSFYGTEFDKHPEDSEDEDAE